MASVGLPPCRCMKSATFPAGSRGPYFATKAWANSAWEPAAAAGETAAGRRASTRSP